MPRWLQDSAQRFVIAVAHAHKHKEGESNMSEDNNIISEERTTLIVDAAQNIAQDSDAMGQNLVAIAKALQPVGKQAGIEYDGDLYMLKPTTSWEDSWYLFLDKFSEWELRVAIVDREHEHEEYRAFAYIPRWMVAEIVECLPDFIAGYCAEMECMHQKYSDLRKKAEQIRAIIESDSEVEQSVE